MIALSQDRCWMAFVCACVCVRACVGVRDCWEYVLCCWVCSECVRPLKFNEIRISLLTWMSRTEWHDLSTCVTWLPHSKSHLWHQERKAETLSILELVFELLCFLFWIVIKVNVVTDKMS